MGRRVRTCVSVGEHRERVASLYEPTVMHLVRRGFDASCARYRARRVGDADAAAAAATAVLEDTDAEVGTDTFVEVAKLILSSQVLRCITDDGSSAKEGSRGSRLPGRCFISAARWVMQDKMCYQLDGAQ